MSKSLLEQLPNIVAANKRQAAPILKQLEGTPSTMIKSMLLSFAIVHA
jgi:hypothetical protein